MLVEPKRVAFCYLLIPEHVSVYARISFAGYSDLLLTHIHMHTALSCDSTIMHLPMQYTANFKVCKNDVLVKNNIFLLPFTQNIDCWYTLEPPQWCGSYEYPQSMF